MPTFDWNELKNTRLKSERGIGFEDVVHAINNNLLIEVKEHSNQEKYPNQKIYIFAVNNYVYVCPFIENNDIIFMKTIFPTRKLTKEYLKGDKK